MIPIIGPLEGEVLGPGDGVTIHLKRHPFVERPTRLVLPAGLSLAEIVDQHLLPAEPTIRRGTLILRLAGETMPAAIWPRLRPKAGASLVAVGVPRGKGIFKSLALIAVAIVALIAAPYLAGALFGAGSVFGGAAGLSAAFITNATYAIGGILTIGGSLAVNALFPVAKPKNTASALSGSSDAATQRSPSYAIGGGRNEQRPYGVVPVVLGTHRVSPAYAARPFTEIVGDDQYLRAIFIWGYGPIAISDLKIGETPIGNFEGVEVATYADYVGGTIPLYPATVFEEQLSVELTAQFDAWVARTTADEIDEWSVDIQFPNGVFRYVKATGARDSHSVTLEIQYRNIAGGGWASAGLLAVASSLQDAVRRTVRVAVARGQYEIRIKRADGAYAGEDTVSEACAWTAIRGVRGGSPVQFDEPVTLTALRIKATAQLSGSIETLNGVCQGLVRAWSGASWVAGQASSNPADLFRHVLQGTANARPRRDDEIDLASLQAWHGYCAANGFRFDQVRDFQSSVPDTLRDLCAAGRAALSYRDGLWGVIFDEGETPTRQDFTPRNSAAFSSQKGFADLPHGFRIRFKNARNGWLDDERIVYDDGYDVSNATLLEGIEFPGVTDPDLIWRHGRYHIAQLRLRPEEYSLQTDFEHIVCTRGDRVRVQHDVTLWGQGAGRVKAVLIGPDRVVIDEPMDLVDGSLYAVRFRLSDGASLVRNVAPASGRLATLTLEGVGDLPAQGDLFMFGLRGLETVVLRVKAIEPQRDLTARLILVDDAPAIAFADQGAIPAFVTGIAAPFDVRASVPRDVTAAESLYPIDGTVRSRLRVFWRPPALGAPTYYVVERRLNGGPWQGRTVVPHDTPSTDILDITPGTYEIRVRSAFASAAFSAWSEPARIVADLAIQPPDDVTGFAISAAGDLATLTWDRQANINVSHYRIRYSRALTGATWSNSVVLFDRVLDTVQAPARRGTYLIKAVTYQGVESLAPALIVTTVSSQTNFNVVEALTEDPTFAGAKTNVIEVGGELRLDESDDLFALADFFAPADFFFGVNGLYASGIYDFADIVDLVDVYTVRLNPLIEAFGLNIRDDVFAREDFFGLADFFDVDPSAWSAVIEARVTVDDPGGTPVWSPWAPLTAGSVAGRAFAFRLVLTSSQRNITPVVTGLGVEVDMPDRVIAENDLAVGTGGVSILFDPPFRSLQGLAVSAQGLATGDYYALTAKSEMGFTIRFYDAAAAPVARTFDYVAKGYGAVQ